MIFDTDVLIGYFRADACAARLIESQPIHAISIVTLMELIQGARSKQEVATIRRFLREYEFEILPISEEISYMAAALIEEHAQSNGLQLADALIAAAVRDRG